MATKTEVEKLMAAGDHIGALVALVREAGGTMTLHGAPIDGPGRRRAALASSATRVAGAATTKELVAFQRWVIKRHDKHTTWAQFFGGGGGAAGGAGGEPRKLGNHRRVTLPLFGDVV
jgi:hypothetical protein